jgi:hypothetical protein
MTALRADAADFRKTREARFGKPLEEVVAGRDKSVEGFRRTLEPMRLTLNTQPCLGGEKPSYADLSRKVICRGIYQCTAGSTSVAQASR